MSRAKNTARRTTPRPRAGTSPTLPLQPKRHVVDEGQRRATDRPSGVLMRIGLRATSRCSQNGPGRQERCGRLPHSDHRPSSLRFQRIRLVEPACPDEPGAARPARGGAATAPPRTLLQLLSRLAGTAEQKKATITTRRIRPPQISHEVLPRSSRFAPAPGSQRRSPPWRPAWSPARRSPSPVPVPEPAPPAAAAGAAAVVAGAAGRWRWRGRGRCRDRRLDLLLGQDLGLALRHEGRGELVALAQVRQQDRLAILVDADSPLVDLALREHLDAVRAADDDASPRRAAS